MTRLVRATVPLMEAALEGDAPLARALGLSVVGGWATRSRGLATEATLAMVQEAFADGRVTTVIAHTLPERGASSRVLEKAGFRHDGEATENGRRVWR